MPRAQLAQAEEKRTDEPVLVRRNIRLGAAMPSLGPGLHSHNRTRRRNGASSAGSFRILRAILLVLGICGTGYYLYALADEHVYQAYQNWSFDQQIAGRPDVVFGDYLREKTSFGFLAGSKSESTKLAAVPALSSSPTVSHPPSGSLLGRVSIPRLNLAAIVREGVDATTLKNAVGHVPSTALPGAPGNLAIAAHRDTLFRALKDIQKGDLVTFQSAKNTYTYQVEATKIVKPSDVSVLASDGGGLIPQVKGSHGLDPLLTMITCYPFYYVGAAPKRFIVEGRLIPAMQTIRENETTVRVPVPRAASSKRPVVHHRRRGVGHRAAHR